MSEHSGMDEPLHYGGSELVQPLQKCTENPWNTKGRTAEL